MYVHSKCMWMCNIRIWQNFTHIIEFTDSVENNTTYYKNDV